MSYHRQQQEDQIALQFLVFVFGLFLGVCIAAFIVAIMWDSSYTQMLKQGFTTHRGVIYVVEPMKTVND